MLAELFTTGDREFQTAGAVMLNALDWKLILVAGCCNVQLAENKLTLGFLLQYT